VRCGASRLSHGCPRRDDIVDDDNGFMNGLPQLECSGEECPTFAAIGPRKRWSFSGALESALNRHRVPGCVEVREGGVSDGVHGVLAARDLRSAVRRDRDEDERGRLGRKFAHGNAEQGTEGLGQSAYQLPLVREDRRPPHPRIGGPPTKSTITSCVLLCGAQTVSTQRHAPGFAAHARPR
jgi:hypothetical protein